MSKKNTVKWNGRIYKVVREHESSVVLELHEDEIVGHQSRVEVPKKDLSMFAQRKMTVAEVEQLIKANNWGFTYTFSEIKILARYADDSVIVGYVQQYESTICGKHTVTEQRVCCIKEGRKVWDMIAG